MKRKDKDHLMPPIKKNFQVSYMIVDDADCDFEMSEDPFLEAGITAPPILPYQDQAQAKTS